MPHPGTRHSLIVRLSNKQNDSAWTEFVTVYEAFLYRMAERQGVPERHVPDVVQQVLLAVAKSVDLWKDDGRSRSFRRWLATVSRNIVIRFMTRGRSEISGPGGTDFLELLKAVPDEPDQQHIQQYEQELIVWAAEQVKHDFLPTSWAAFRSTMIEDRPVSEVANELKITPGSIYMSRSRIMAAIRTRIQNVMGDD